MTGAGLRIVVMIDAATSRRSPRRLRDHARDAWLEAVMRCRAHGRIELVTAEELIRAWPVTERRR